MALVALLLAGCGGSGGSADGPAAARSPVDPLGGAIPEPAPVVSEGGEPPEPSDHAARPALPSPEEIERLPADGGPDFNRLVHEQSPYLLQHARNPVDWYPWGEEAFEAARREGKLIFLSVGYSTCHWCHVMERESFETQEVADALAEDYVAVKVDREERPDIDQIYMTVTQVLRGQGGWPNSVWLTPEGRPWFAATYLPKERFVGLLEKLGDAWETEREEVEEQARRISAAARRILEGRSDGRAEGPLARSVVDELIRELRSVFDAEYGGFGGAPKFPPHQTLRLLLYEHGRTRDPGVLELVTTTLDGMARGGIRDHVGGGFHRYSTDARWFLPHFEKMLYDNALLLRSYAVAWDQTRTPRYREVAEELAAWALRVMRGRHGAFYSALDADSAGEEGAFYVWRPAELVEVLGPEDAALFSRVYGITPEGNFREEATGERTGASLPHLEASLPVVAEERGLELAALQDRLERILRTLGERRSEREWPHRDDKVLTSWNGAMIGGLARAGGALDVPEYLDAARRAADFLLREARRGERLRRSYRGGEGSGDGYAEDYAFLADGLLELFDVTGEVRWLEEAKRLVEVLLARFRDPEAGGFFYSSDDHERLLARPKDPTDGALPSANGVATLVLVRLAEATGEARYAREARRILEEFQPLIRRAPRATQSLILGLARFLDGAAAELAAPDSHEPGEVRVRDRPVTLILVPTRQEVRPGETLPVTARLEIDAGWHVNSASPAQEFLIPTRLELADRPGVGLAGTDYPPPSEQRLEFSDAPLEVYEGVVSLRASVVVSDAAPAGETPLEFRLRVQPCDARRCLDPRTLRATLPIRVLGTGGER